MAKAGIILFFTICTTLIHGQISYLSCDSANVINYTQSMTDSTSMQIGDFDGDQLSDTCIAIIKGSHEKNQSKGLLFVFGNGEKKFLGANSNSIVKEIFDIHEQQQTILNDLSILHWKQYNIRSIKKKYQGDDSKSNSQIPSLEHIVHLNLSPYYERINKHIDLLLLDTGDVWYVLCKSKDEWLFINLGV